MKVAKIATVKIMKSCTLSKFIRFLDLFRYLLSHYLLMSTTIFYYFRKVGLFNVSRVFFCFISKQKKNGIIIF